MTKLHSLEATVLRLPFRQSFRHQSATRHQTAAIIVRATTSTGQCGWGEGCPRPYVTHETVESCLEFFERHRADALQLACVRELRDWVHSSREVIDDNPAAWCAMELSLLDAMARDARVSVEGLLDLPAVRKPMTYSAVLGVSEERVFHRQLQQYLRLGFGDFKLKVSADQTLDGQRLSEIQHAAPQAAVRLDGNNCFATPEQALDYLSGLPVVPSALEEPLSARDYAGLRQLARQSEIPIIVDESFLRREQLSDVLSLGGRGIVNLRVSKLGGLLRSLGVAEQAQRDQIPLVVGAQVGETSLLTRAAICVSQAFDECVVAREGAFGTHLLETDIVSRPLMFGAGGKLDPSQVIPPRSHGWGLEVGGWPWCPANFNSSGARR